MKLYYPLILCFLSVAIFSACTKKSTGTNCLISNVAIGSNKVVFSYDNQNRLSKIKYAEITKEYSYNGDTVTILASSAAGSKKIILLKNGNLIENAFYQLSDNGLSWENIAFSYNGKELIQEVRTYSNGNPSRTISHRWANNNWDGMAGSTTKNIYFDEIDFQTADYYNIMSLVDAEYNPINNKNLIKGFDNISFGYTCDKQGKIIKIDGGIMPMKVEYTCR